MRCWLATAQLRGCSACFALLSDEINCQAVGWCESGFLWMHVHAAKPFSAVRMRGSLVQGWSGAQA